MGATLRTTTTTPWLRAREGAGMTDSRCPPRTSIAWPASSSWVFLSCVGHGHVEPLAVAFVLPGFLGAAGDDLDLDLEPGRRLDEERGLVLVGLDEGDVQLGTGDLQREPRQPTTRPDVDQAPRGAEVVEQHQRVGDEVVRRARDEARPALDHPREFGQPRILH